MDSLIDPVSGWWNINLIDWCFHPPDASLIKSLPLSFIPQPDTLVWNLEKSGSYSIKSDYKSLCEMHNRDMNHPQVSKSQKGFWRCIWKLEVPGKIKQFLWRAYTNSLTTMENLRKHKILEETECSCCAGTVESVAHALWSCNCIKTVWDTNFGWVDRSAEDTNSFLDVLQKIRAKPAFVSLFVVTAWAIWYQRNKTRLRDNPLPLRNIAGFTKDYLNQFRGTDRPSVLRNRVTTRKWLPPTTGSVKINYDGAMFGESDKVGLGVVIRTCDGQVVAALSEQIVKPPIVEILELLVARWAVFFLQIWFIPSVFTKVTPYLWLMP